ncbi:hypothetical protein QT969_23745 [Rhodococcus sp. CSLK01-03]|uniref:MFS transporter n=1 Tax=Rhodococcus indonesiensis TaxID=3055869 RepID=A0ABT7RUG9_9NOCA|nr:hypothetical protein [Rhodococcus indonesiensis]MDM7491302.1 hypothetical protein [Rhodococcus indonesiensis]
MNPRPPTPTQLRGAFVGSTSAAVSVAAHGLAGGEIPPQASVVLMVAACAAFGAALSAVRSPRPLTALVLALTAGQAIGHTVLTLTAEHAHGLGLSPAMLGAHAAALVVSAALIRAAEQGCVAALGVLRHIVAAILTLPPAHAPLWVATPSHRARLVLRVLVSAQAGTRGPPRTA